MKTLRICGWAVIFTATFLLAACASHNAGLADTTMMSGPDATISQLEEQNLTFESRVNALVIRQAWLDERELQLDNRTTDLDRRENALEIQTAWMTQLARDRGDGIGGSVKLAGAESTKSRDGLFATKVESGRCYADVFIPAQYRTVAVTKPIELPKGEHLPTLYQTVTEQVKVSDEFMSREEILCEGSMTPCRITEIQRALSRGGYNPGPIDGVVGHQTMAAVNAFQKDFNLIVADQLTTETVKALDVHF